MNDYTYWILYSQSDDNKVLVFKTRKDDYLSYYDICLINRLDPSDYLFDCITTLGFKILSKVFFDFADDNLKSKEVKINE